MPLPYISKLDVTTDSLTPLPFTARIEKESLFLTGDKTEYVISYRHTETIESRNYHIYIHCDNKVFHLSGLGYNYEDFLRELMGAYNEQLLNDLLMNEKLIWEARGEWTADTGTEPADATFRLYENALVAIPWDHSLIRIPYCFIKSFNVNNYNIRIEDLFNKTYTMYRLGRDQDPFIREYNKCIGEMYKRSRETLKSICTDVPGSETDRMSLYMPDGTGVPVQTIMSVSPAIMEGFEKYLSAASVFREYSFLMELSSGDQIYFGVKRGLMGDLTGNILWYMVPLINKNGLKNAVALEIVQDGKAAGATYFYQLNDISGEAGWRSIALEINHALIGINFRREPIYISDEALNEPRNEGCRISVNRLPVLRKIRKLFLGRVIHNDFEKWSSNVYSLLKL